MMAFAYVSSPPSDEAAAVLVEEGPHDRLRAQIDGLHEASNRRARRDRFAELRVEALAHFEAARRVLLGPPALEKATEELVEAEIEELRREIAELDAFPASEEAGWTARVARLVSHFGAHLATLEEEAWPRVTRVMGQKAAERRWSGAQDEARRAYTCTWNA